MSPEEKLVFVGKQVLELNAGDGSMLACPYCGGFTAIGATFCCSTMDKAVNAILDANKKMEASHAG